MYVEDSKYRGGGFFFSTFPSKFRGDARRHADTNDEVHRLGCSVFISRFEKSARVAILLYSVSGVLRV